MKFDALAAFITWLLPLAIILSLPYESFHGTKLSQRFSATLHWIGSPQTALTAVLFNLSRRRQLLRHQDRANGKDNSRLSIDAYYILSCLSQFDTPPLTDADGKPSHMLRSLLYGLFRPLSDDTEVPDVELTRQMLPQLAFQLRMQRRRAIVPIISAIFAFLLGFVCSVVTMFIDIEDWHGASRLVIALLFLWLPVLVIFTALDWNPISTTRASYVFSSFGILLRYFLSLNQPFL